MLAAIDEHRDGNGSDGIVRIDAPGRRVGRHIAAVPQAYRPAAPLGLWGRGGKRRTYGSSNRIMSRTFFFSHIGVDMAAFAPPKQRLIEDYAVLLAYPL